MAVCWLSARSMQPACMRERLLTTGWGLSFGSANGSQVRPFWRISDALFLGVFTVYKKGKLFCPEAELFRVLSVIEVNVFSKT